MIESTTESTSGTHDQIFIFPWESVKVPVDPQLEKITIDTFDSVGLFKEYPKLKDAAYALDPSTLGPHLFPFAKGKTLEALTIWLTAIFLYDDVLEMKGTGETEINKMCDAFVGELKNIDKEPRSEIRLIAKAGEGINHLPQSSKQIFRARVREYLESLKMEAYHIERLAAHGHPNIETYLKVRLPLSGTVMTIDMIDLEMPEVLPEKWHRHSLVEEIKKLGGLLMAYHNDYVSIANRDEDKMNIAFAIAHDFCLGPDESTQLLIDMHNATVNRLLKLCHKLDTESNSDPIVKIWIDYLLNSISGCAKWHLMSTRY